LPGEGEVSSVSRPSRHFAASLIIFGLSYSPSVPLLFMSKGILVPVLIFVFGCLIDLDHLSPRRIRQFLKGPIRPTSRAWADSTEVVGEHLNSLHTWPALGVAITVSIRINNYLPLFSYLIHIGIDALTGYGEMNNWHVPTVLGRIWARFIKAQ